MALAPHWLDNVIDQAMQDGADDYAIAEAIAKNERVIAAIARGRANAPAPGMMAAGPAQVIRVEVCDAIAASR